MTNTKGRVCLPGLAAGLLLAISPIGAFSASTNTPVEGALGPSFQTCLQLLTFVVSQRENCMYGGVAIPAFSIPPTGEQIGPLSYGFYYSSITRPQAFDFTYADAPGDGKISPRMTGTFTINDNGTPADGSDDLISFTLAITDPLGGDIIRFLGGQIVDRYQSLTQVLPPWPVNSATPNELGGFDYVIASAGFPPLLTFSDPAGSPCDGAPFGTTECTNTFTGPPARDTLKWLDWPASVGLGSLEGNLGAKTTGTLVNPACVGPASGNSTCRVSQASYGPWYLGPNDTAGGGSGTFGTPGAIRGSAEDAGWDQLLLRVSTDRARRVVAVAGFDVEEYRAFGPERCGDNLEGTGDYVAQCNNWISGHFTLGSDLPPLGVANDDGPLGVQEETPRDINILANDTDFNDPVTVTIVTPPTKGVAVVNGSPGNAAVISITYTANAAASGTDSFVYRVADAVIDDTATVSLVIGAGANDDTATTTRNRPVAINIGANDEGFGPNVFVTIDDGSFTAGGSAVVSAGNGGPAAGIVVAYTPSSPPGSPGYVESFVYIIDDGDLDPTTATVTVTVNNTVPVATDAVLASISTVRNAPLARTATFTAPGAGGSLGNTGPGAAVTISAQGSRGNATVAGNVITYTITDPAFFSGSDQFTYLITDSDGETDSGEITISIADVAPALAVWNLGTYQGEATVPTELGAFITWGNGSESQHTVLTTAQAAQGICAVVPANGTGRLVYTPNPGFSGTDSCQITVADGDGDSSARTVSISVVPVVQVDARIGGASAMPWWAAIVLVLAGMARRRPTQVAGVVGLIAAGLVLPVGAQAIEEIVVTSRKVEERLQEVPLAITAFDSAAIEAARITNLYDVAELTPGLNFFNAFGENLPVPVIRGVVPTDIFGRNNAAVFVDGVYISGREGLNFSQLDLERIEVVKGPQSALYGRNAFSGAINYVTKAPSDTFESRLTGEVGNRDKVKGIAMISGPILGDNLRGRLSMLYDDWDGSYDNAVPGGSDIGGYRYRSYQAQLQWLPADSWVISASYYKSNDNIDEPATVSFPANCEDRVDNSPGVRLQNVCGRVPDIRLAPGLNGSRAIPKVEQAVGENRELDRANLVVNWDAGAWGSFNSLFGYSRTRQSSYSDFLNSLGHNSPFLYCFPATLEAPGTPNSCGQSPADQRFFTGIYQQQNGARAEEFSEELRWTSPVEWRARPSFGAYWYKVTDESLDGNTIATRPLPEIPAGTAIGLAPFDVLNAPDLAIGTAIFWATFLPDGGLDPLNRVRATGEEEAWALFGSLDFDFTEQLTGRVELRYTQEKQNLADLRYVRCRDRSAAGFAECGDEVYDLRDTGALPFLDTLPLDENGVQLCPVFDSVGSRSPCSNRAGTRFSYVTGRLGLDYKLNPDWMLYGSVGYGEKPGGIRFVASNVIPPAETQLEPFAVLRPNLFDKEELIAYEVGAKGAFQILGRPASLDVSAFYNDWRSIVFRQLIETDEVTGYPFNQPRGFNVNAGDATVIGLEISSNVLLTDNLTGSFTLGWQDAELDNARQDTYAEFPSFRAPGCETAPLDPDEALACNKASGDVSGNRLLRQPEWMLSGSLNYQRQLRGEWDWFARGSASYQGAVYVGNENQGWLPSHTYVNTSVGLDSGRYKVELWVRNLLNDGHAIAAFRDIYWANNSSLYPPYADLGPRPTIDEFPPFRYTVTYPRLRTFGITAEVRFGSAVR